MASRQTATRLSRTAVSPAATASLVCISVQKAHPLIWLALRLTSSWVAFGSDDRTITMLVLAKRLPNLAAISLSNMLSRASMTLLVALLDWTHMRCRRPDPCDSVTTWRAPHVTKRRAAVSFGCDVESEETGLAHDRHAPGCHRGVPRPPQPALHGRL